MKLPIAILFLFTTSGLLSQESDSLQVASWLDAAKKSMNQNADIGFQYLDSIATHVKDESHNTYQKADFHKVMGIGLYRKSLYDSSTFHYEKALELFNKGDYELDVAKISVNLSINYNRLANFEKTIESATRALKMFEELGDKKGIGISSNIIGQVYFFNEDWSTSKKYFFRYLTNALGAQDSTEIAGGYSNLGSVYTKLEQIDSALFYNKNALNFHLSLGNQYGIGNAYQNIGANFLSRGNLDSAIFYYQNALPIYQSTENKSGITETYVNLGKSHLQKGNLETAIQYATSGLNLAEEIKEEYLKQEAYKTLAESYEEKKAYQKALSFYKLYDQTAEEIFDEETRANIEEINTKYETEKKEQQIALQEAEIAEQEAELKRKQTLLIGSVVLILAIVALALTQRSRLRKKQQIKLQEAQLKTREAEIAATISSQEKERARYARDLHDGFGQMISMLHINLKNLKEGAKPDERQSVFKSSAQVIDQMYGELKNICFDLMPQTLVKHGLESALREFTDRINETGKVQIELHTFGLENRLTEIQEISLYRISQEWINNILKYSDAEKVTLQITKDAEEITLLVEDDGSGFARERLTAGKGNGWKNLNTRTKLIKGKLELETEPGKRGSVLIVNAPTVFTHSEVSENTMKAV